MGVQRNPKRWPVKILGIVSALVVVLMMALPVVAAGPVERPELPSFHQPHLGRMIPVQGSSQFLHGNVTVERGQVIEADLMVYSGNVEIESGGRVNGDLIVFTGNIEIEEGGSVGGNVVNYSGNISVAGEVSGDLTAMNGDIELESTAQVNGDISVVSGRIRRDDGASVGGNMLQGPSFRFPGARGADAPDVPRPGFSFSTRSDGILGSLFNLIGRLLIAALSTVLALLLVSALFYVRPQLIVDTRQQLHAQLALSAVVGGLANLTVLFLTGLLAVTLCLLPLALIPMLALIAVNVVGWAVISQIVGEKIVAFAKQEVKPILTLLVGAFFLTGLVALLWALGGCFQFVAWLLAFVVGSLGSGAALLPWINRRRGAGGTGDSGAGDGGVPPVVPTSPGPSSAYGTDVEQDVAAPVDYVTAEEVNAGQRMRGEAEQGAELADVDVRDAQTRDAAESDVVEQDVAQPLDYVTAQEVNTTDVLAEGDDFLQLRGIGPTYARRLKEAGFTTFAQLAATTPEAVAAAIGLSPDRVRRAELIDQAKVLANQ